MASLVSDVKVRGMRSRPWRARVKVDGVEEWLGNYPTREEAAAVEAAFRAERGLSTSKPEQMRRYWEQEKLRTGR